jgi:glycosyltransferase involved in cell wall biosynthesis
MLAILTTHPIQYQVPLWQALARDKRIPFEVWYLTDHGINPTHDPQFRRSFAWDLDMLSGYPHRFLEVAPGAAPNSFWKCRLRESLAKRMHEANVKALWVQGWQVAAYWQAVWAAKTIGVEVWLRGESNDIAPTPFWKRAVKRVILGQLFHRVDRFLYIGTANRRLYEKFGVSAGQLYPAPYAVDNERFAGQADAIRDQRAEIRSQWGIPENAFCVLFCGKFIRKKRPLDLVKAAQLLLPARRALQLGEITNNSVTVNYLSDIHLLFVGSGELGGELRAHCNVVFDAESPSTPGNKEPITDNRKPAASFAGFLNQTEISKAYVAADCLVLPSDYGETWGLVVNEAMASGLPCVISDQSGCAEDLGSFSPNEIFRCGDILALEKRIASFSSVKPIGSPRVEFRHLYSLGNAIDTVIELYQAAESSRAPLGHRGFL